MRKMNNVKFGALFLASLMLFEPTLHAAQFVSYARNNSVFDMGESFFDKHLSFIKTQFNADWLDLLAYEEQLEEAKLENTDELDWSEFFDEADFLGAEFTNMVQLAAPMPDGGPDQPEVQSFSPIDVSDMVDPFTGDFSYNIPLMDVDGYPLNIAYNAGVTMDQEASWVGLGWNLNPGVINRNLRGLPDEFDGSDVVEKEISLKDNKTISATMSADVELVGFNNLGLSAGNTLTYNNYDGWSSSVSFGIQMPISNSSVGLSFNGSSSDGATISPNVSLNLGFTGNSLGKLNVGSSINTRSGLSQVNISYSNPTKKGKNTVVQRRKTRDGFRSVNARDGYRASASFDLGMTSFSPSIRYNMYSIGFTFSVKVGGDVVGLDASGTTVGAFSKSQVMQNKLTKKAYGYGYLHLGQSNKDAYLDYSRENDGPFTQNTPALPLPVLTYDVFSVQGQGISGSFRPVRSDIGYVFDARSITISDNASLGGEVNLGLTAKGGLDINLSFSQGHSGVWDKGNQAANVIGFKNSNVFFREAGEFSIQNELFHFNAIGGFKPVRFLNSSYNQLGTTLVSHKNTQNSALVLPVTNPTRSTNPIRNKVMTTLTVGDVRYGAGIKPFPVSSYAFALAPDHHIGEFTVLNTEGTRYVYGLPAYSLEQIDASFAVDGTQDSYDCQHGLITYNSSNNNIGNNAGMDGFYEKEIKPAFAHSYLLTTVLNSDYVDADNIPGPSKGDLGGYLVLNYKKLSIPETSTYKWRNPVQANKAFFDEGMNSMPNDQKAHYMYGEKEIWYVEEIISKNHIARFYMSNRDDAVSVNGENGGLDSTNLRMQKLDSISLYTIPEYELYLDDAVPIKTVHFVYDYSLCPDYSYNVNSGGGKLTLKSIYFTYENSRKGEYTAYRFNYSEVNPSYNNKHVDRWGNYKAPDGSYSCGNVTSGAHRPWDYPYVTDNKTIADENASAWNLTEILLPSGGKIVVSYESDDYGFVQHKPVHQMYDLVDVGGLYDFDLSPINSNPYITIQMDPGSVPSDYCKIGDEIYFRALMQIYDGSQNSEYVPGFAVVKSLAVVNTNQLKITLEPARIKIAGVSTDQHPFVLAGINFARMYIPKVIPPSNNNTIDGEGQFGQIIQAFAGAYSSFGELFLGVNGYLLVQNVATQLNVAKSHVRLKKPNGTRFGGGHRVKEVRIYDSWGEMSGLPGQDFYFGQQYSYHLDSTQRSSGVAAYEPQLGGDENVWRKPVHYISKEIMLAPDEANMQFEPFGEQFFPSPTVGYSRVTISNLERSGVHRTATGYVVHEFYTAKDYPTIVRRTAAEPEPGNIKFKFSIFGGTTAQRLSASQGFVVETNNMHGVPKAQTVYAQGSHTSPITKIEYKYFDTYDQSVGHQVLVNNMLTIEKNGQISSKIIGINYDAVADFRESLHESLSKSHDFNLNYTMPFIFLPMLLGQTNKNYTELRTASFVKVIERFGIQKKTTAHDLGSVVETENLAWDAETGEILVTRTKTNFEDDIYSFTYPAHWHYDLMGQAYRNAGKDFVFSPSGQLPSGFGSEVIKLNVAVLFNNGMTGQLNNQHFALGDELFVTTNTGTSFKAWVTECSQSGIRVEDKYGNPISGLFHRIRILRSGRRNLQTTPIGSIVLRENPIPALGGNIFDKVLQAGAVEYSDDWRTFCECFRDGDSTVYTTNPYVLGLRGTWRPKASYVHLAGRTQTYDDGNSNIRHDGMFTSFTPFYRLENGKWVIDRRDWTYTSSVVEFSPFGQALETIDALDRYSSSMYGYNQTLPIAVAANTRYRQLGFDGFEDYAFDNCSDNHFRVALGNESGISTQESHTGRHSFKVTSGNTYRFSADLVAECDSLAPVFEPCPIEIVCNGVLQIEDIESVSTGVMYFEISGGQAPYNFDFEVNNPDVTYDIVGGLIVIYGPPTVFYNGLLNTTLTITDQTGCNQIFIVKDYICLPE